MRVVSKGVQSSRKFQITELLLDSDGSGRHFKDQGLEIKVKASQLIRDMNMGNVIQRISTLQLMEDD